MIITERSEFIAEVQDLMSVLLAEKDFEPLLSGEAGFKKAVNDLLH
jgi:hypothetical protein